MAAAVAVIAAALAGTQLRALSTHDVAFVGVTVVVFGSLAVGARWVAVATRARQGQALSAVAAWAAAGYLNNDVLDAPAEVLQFAGYAAAAMLATLLAVTWPGRRQPHGSRANVALSAGRRAAGSS